LNIKQLEDELRSCREFIPESEYYRIYGRCLLQPFSACNSGYRKLMYAIHVKHALNLIKAERAYIATGHENKIGDKSSYKIDTKHELKVISKISKFAFTPNHHYYLLVQDEETKTLGVIERISYKHCSESTGFFYNNEYLDSLVPTDDCDTINKIRDDAYTLEWDRYQQKYSGAYCDDTTIDMYASGYADSIVNMRTMIPKGTTIKKSTAFDADNNYMQGVNLLTAYMDCNQLTEDPVKMSISAARKFYTPQVKPVSICINENDLLIDIHGTGETYKPLPDIGEIVKDNRLYCLRRQVKEDCLYTQSKERLRQPMPSDEFSPVKGMVVDYDIYCNNPSALDLEYNKQLKFYYDNQMRFAAEMLEKIRIFMNVHPDYKMSTDLRKMEQKYDKMVRGVQFIMDDKPFNNMRVDVTVVEHNPLSEGDKICNRYGGKGVTAKIVPDEEMPIYIDENGNERRVELLWRSSTGINRENAGQYKEICLNNFSCQILDHIRGMSNRDDQFNELTKFLDIVQPAYSEKLKNAVEDHLVEEEMDEFWKTLFDMDCIPLILDPYKDHMGYDDFYKIYEAFPYIIMPTLQVPVKDCKGNTRFVTTRRPVGVGHQYIYRLKQYAEEKYSETSLSTVNIKGDNAKSKASKEYKELHKRTAIRMGHMENDSLSHIGTDAVVTFLMLYSVSPTGRLHAKDILVGDPFNVNLRLDENDRNRKVETYKTRFEAMGLELVIDIKKKKPKQLEFSDMFRVKEQPKPKKQLEFSDMFRRK